MVVEGIYWHQDPSKYVVMRSQYSQMTIYRNISVEKFLISPEFKPLGKFKVKKTLSEFIKISTKVDSELKIEYIKTLLSAENIIDFQSRFDSFIDYVNSISHSKKIAMLNLLLVLHREKIIGMPLNRRIWFKDLQVTRTKLKEFIPQLLVNKAGRDNVKETIKGKVRGNEYANMIYTPLLSLCGVSGLTDLSPNIFSQEFILTNAEGLPLTHSGIKCMDITLGRLFHYLSLQINHHYPNIKLVSDDFYLTKNNIKNTDSIAEYIDDLKIKYSSMHEWIKYGENWIRGQKRTKGHFKSAFRIFLSCLSPVSMYHDPKNYFLSKNLGRPIPPTGYKNLLILQKYVNYVFEKVCIIEDEFHRKIYEVGYDRVELGGKKEVIFSPTTLKEKIPHKFLDLIHEIIVGDDFAWPKLQQEDYFDWINPETEKAEKVWYPGRASAVLLMFHLPLRVHQISVLTSGIGDSYQLEFNNYDNENWYSWKDTGHRGTRGQIIQRGVIRPFEASPGVYIPVFYISTNKTHDRNQKTADKGYVLPYTKKEAFKIIYDFIQWSDKYIQTKSPIPYSAISYYRIQYSKNELDVMGQDHFLWLDPCRGGVLDKKNIEHFWYKLMIELEKRWNENAEPNAKIRIVLKNIQEARIERKQKLYSAARGELAEPDSEFSSREKKLRWTLHCMRVTGITWMMNHGVPLDIIRAIAGHANEYMTMYYVVRSPLDVEAKIKIAQERASISASDDCISYIKANFDSPKNLIARVFANSQDCLKNINANALLTDIGTGLCPVGCNGCDMGYEVQVETGTGVKVVFQPVPGGKESCELCQFYLSYPSYLDKLKIRWNYLFWVSRENYLYLQELTGTIHQLSVEKEQARKRGEIFHKNDLIDAYQRKADAAEEKTKISTLLLQRVSLIIQKFQIQPGELGISSEEAVIYGNPAGLKMVIEMCHPFVALHNIVAGSIIEPFINPSDELPYFKLAQMIDRMYAKSGLPPFVYQPHGPSREKQLVDHCDRLAACVPPTYYAELFNPECFEVTLRSLGLVDPITNTLTSVPRHRFDGIEKHQPNLSLMNLDLQKSKEMKEMKEIMDSVIHEEEDGENEEEY